jgi:predicted O-methyltransferase YrrM
VPPVALASDLRLLAARLPALRALPLHVAMFQARALLLAVRLGDTFAVQSATRSEDVASLLNLATGRRRIVELGTATGWTTASFALADPDREVLSFDPVVQAHRERYLTLLPARARERIRLVRAPGVEGPPHAPEPVDLLFIDSTHERDDTIAEIEAWRPRLADDAIVVLHDYDNPAFPGVREAVEALGLPGAPTRGSFVWQISSEPVKRR